MDKPLIPFGEILEAQQRCKVRWRNSIFVYVGHNALEACRAYNERVGVGLYLPMNAEVSDFRWPIKGYTLILTDEGGMKLLTLKKITYYLLLEGAAKVCIHTPNCPILIYGNQAYQAQGIDSGKRK